MAEVTRRTDHKSPLNWLDDRPSLPRINGRDSSSMLADSGLHANWQTKFNSYQETVPTIYLKLYTKNLKPIKITL